MANIKFTEFPSATVVGSMDIIPIVQDGANKKTTAAIFATYMGTLFASLTGTQTLTNKTLTSPKINQVLDSNGNEILAFTPITSAVDYISIKNGIGVGVPLHISATGDSANIGLHIEPKGSGLVQVSDGTDVTKGIRFRSSASATGAVTLIDAVSSAGRVITLPNATGTLALTTQIPSVSGTTNYLPKFTGTSALGNSVIYDDGTNITIGGANSFGWKTFINSGANASNLLLGSLTTGVFLAFNDATCTVAPRIAGVVNDLSFTTNSTERMRITSAGNVGIGTTSPASKLHVLDSINTYSSNFQGVGGTSFVALGTKTGNVPAINGFTANFAGSANIVLQADGGNLLIGTTTDAGYKLDVNGTARVSGVVTANDAILSNIKPSVNFTLSVNPAFSHSIVGENYSSGAAANNYMDFKVANAANTQQLALRLFGTGSAEFTSGLSLNNASAPASGIEFPATQVASASANNLDDYEEGTFTPTIAGSTSAGTATYIQQVGVYTKIGRQVSIQIDLGWNSGTGTGDIRINGLPFNDGSSTNPAVTIGFIDQIVLTSLNYATAYIASLSNRIDIIQTPIGGGNVTMVNYDAAGRLILNATYFV